MSSAERDKPNVPSMSRFSVAVRKHNYRRHARFSAATKDNYSPFGVAICRLFRYLQKTSVPSSGNCFGHVVDSKKLCFFHSIWKQISRAVKFFKKHSTAIGDCFSEAFFSQWSRVHRDEMHSNKMIAQTFFKVVIDFILFCKFPRRSMTVF